MSTPDLPPKYMFEPNEYEWIEKAGLENLKGRLATADTLAKEAGNTLTILLAGAGGSYAYAVKLLDEAATRGSLASLVAGAWLTLLAMGLVWRCLMIQTIPPLYNQPSRLLERPLSGWTFEEFKHGELLQIEVRIGQARDRNNKTAKNLNIIRLLAVCTPILALAAVWLFDRSVR